MVSVLLVDDQRLFIEGLQAILSQEEEIEVVGLASDGEGILDLVNELKPDVILMDMHMSQSAGVETTFQVKTKYPKVKVILLTGSAEEETIVYGLNAGADGFLSRELDRNQLIKAIYDVNYNEVVISGEAAKLLAKRFRDIQYDNKDILNDRLQNRRIYLTNRELEIADLLMDGATNRYISEKLSLSEGTVKNYISDLYSKVDIHHRKKIIDFLKGLIK